MSRYNAEFPFPVAFPPQAMTNVLAEWLGKKDVTQAHIAGKLLHIDQYINSPVTQRLRSTRMSLSSSTAVWRNSSPKKHGT